MKAIRKRDEIPLDCSPSFLNNWHFFNGQIRVLDELVGWIELGVDSHAKSKEEQEEAAGEDKAATELASEKAGDNDTAVS